MSPSRRETLATRKHRLVNEFKKIFRAYTPDSVVRGKEEKGDGNGREGRGRNRRGEKEKGGEVSASSPKKILATPTGIVP
jgi:hypothetical protein